MGVGFDDLPEWVKKIKCDRVDRTGDGSWLFQWKEGPCTLLDFYDSGEVVALGPDPSPEHPDRNGICTINEGKSLGEISEEDREWVEEFIRSGWKGIFDRNGESQ